jgi:hypothetical protein
MALHERIPNSLNWGLIFGGGMQICIGLAIAMAVEDLSWLALTPVFSVLLLGLTSAFFASKGKARLLKGAWISAAPLVLFYGIFFVLFGTGLIAV